jgi:hypothetical protein
LESSGTPECSELNKKAQNTLHWGFLGVIGKVLKCRYRKWSRIGHSDIFSPSYGQKKGRESNCQFDFRSLKVRNRPLPNIQFETWCWKDLDEGYNFGLDLVAIGLAVGSYELPKFRDSNRDNFGTPFRESQQNVPFGCNLRHELHRIVYGGRWWLPGPGCGEFCVSKCPWLVSTPKGVPKW